MAHITLLRKSLAHHSSLCAGAGGTSYGLPSLCPVTMTMVHVHAFQHESRQGGLARTAAVNDIHMKYTGRS